MKVIAFIRKKVDNKKNQMQSKCSRYIMKRVLSITLALSLVVPVVDFACVKEVAAYSSYGDFQYTVLYDGTILITGYDASGSQNEVEIPDMIDGRKVTKIGSRAFYGCSNLTSIKIPETVTSIGDSAFFECSNIGAINIPETVTSIGDCAFSECSSLTGIILSEGLTSIGGDAFSGCSNLTTIEIPNTVTDIGDYAFSKCSSLKGITLPEGLTSIGISAFSRCSSLKGITLPEGLTSIGDGAFSWCSNLTTIEIPKNVINIGDGAFSECSSLTGIILSEGLTSIGGDAFSGCSNLTTIEIPNTVTDIGDRAFLGCSSLTGITLPEGLTSIGGGTFRGCSSLMEITLPEGLTSIGGDTFYGCLSLKEITLPKKLTSIDGELFCECRYLTTIEIPETVTSIGDSAFSGCSSLTGITLPKKLTSIGEWAFNRCSNIGAINIPETVTSIGEWAFSGCSSLTEIKLPEDITRINSSTFIRCYSLARLYISENVSLIGAECFKECSNLSDIYYGGTKEEWNEISIAGGNDYLSTANIHYNYLEEPSQEPTLAPTTIPTLQPTATPIAEPTNTPAPTEEPTLKPTATPTLEPTAKPTELPTATPTLAPTAKPTELPTATPTLEPTAKPTEDPYSEYINIDVNKEVEMSSQENYMFEIDKQGKVLLEISPDEENRYDGYVELFGEDENGNEKEIIFQTIYDNDIKSRAVRLTSGRYYIKLSGDYGNTFNANMTVVYTAEDSNSFETESNNTWNTANDIELNKEYTGNIQKDDDIDIFRFELKQEGSVYLNFYNVNAVSDWIIELYSEDEEKNRMLIEKSYNDNVKNTLFTKYRLPKGIYYIKVNGSDSNDDYSIKVNYTPEISGNCEIEYNNTPDTANKIDVNKQYRGNIPVKTDVDYFTFSLDQASKITLLMGREEGETDKLYKLTMYRKNEDNKLIMYDRFYTGANTVSKGNEVRVPQGTYVILIENGDGAPEDKNDYLLTVNQVVVTDNVDVPTTPEDLRGEAGLPIMVNCKYLVSTKEGRYIFALPEDGEVSFLTDYISGEKFDGRILLYEEDVNGNEIELAEINNSGLYVNRENEYYDYDDEIQAKSIKLEAGRYILKYITNYNNSEQVYLTIQYSKLSELPTSTPMPTPEPTVEPTPIPQPIDVITSTPAPVVTEKPNYAVKLKRVKLKSKLIILKRGKSKTIKYTVTKGYKGKVKFKSSNSKIAKVTSKGKVTGRKKGKCKITVSLSNGNKAVAIVRVK